MGTSQELRRRPTVWSTATTCSWPERIREPDVTILALSLRSTLVAATRIDFSRRTFLLGVGGGAASVSIVWGVSELGLPFLGPGEDSPLAATLDAHAEYDAGWSRPRIRPAGWSSSPTAGTPGKPARDRPFAGRSRPRGCRSRTRGRPPCSTSTTTPAPTISKPRPGRSRSPSVVSDAAGRQQINVLPESMLGGRPRRGSALWTDRSFPRT